MYNLRKSLRASSGMVVAMLVVMSTVPLAAPGAVAAQVTLLEGPLTQQIEGRLVFRDGHTRKIWTLITAAGDAFKLPGQPEEFSSGMPVPAGSMIRLGCKAALGDPANCTAITAANITTSSAPVRTTGLSIKLLVMVISLTGSCSRTGATVSQVQSAYTSTLGYSNFFRNCSYGKVVLESVTAIGTPVACSSAITSKCDEDAMASAAQASVKSQKGSSYLAGFTHFSYVLPNGLLNTCGWVGLAELPGTQTWYTPDNYGIYNKGTVMQETIHNLNIYHGWKNGVEYDDYSTAMGSGNSCPSAPELWRLGWATPVDTLNAATFPAKTFKAYTLPATYLGPDKAMLKIQPDWLGGSYTKNVYLALRVKAGGDRDLTAEFDGKINVHEAAKSIDNNFYAVGDPKLTIKGTVAAGKSLDLSNYKLLVRAEALMESGTKMAVKVCRYDASSTECKDAATQPPPPVVTKRPPPVVAKPSPKLIPSPKKVPSPSPWKP